MDEGLLKRWAYKPVLGTLFYTLAVPGSMIVLVPFLLLTLHFRLIPIQLGIYHYAGWLLISAGAVIYIWAAFEVTSSGKGTPSPIYPPKLLVVRGPYRWMRNPMYASIFLVLLGEAIYFQELILLVYSCLIFVSFNRYILNQEEPWLMKKFGANYRLYCHAIPRWLPKIRTKRL